MSSRIEDYALIGDMQTAALVCRNGSIDWLCLQNFADAAVFAALLGAKEHGSWLIGPAVGAGEQAPYADRRRYRGDSLVLESEWDTPGGTVRVTDFMPPWNGRAPQVIRVIDGVTGEVEMASEFRPRFRYGRQLPWIDVAEGRTVSILGPDALWLDSPATVSSKEKDGAAYSCFTVAAGQSLVFALGWQSAHAGDPDVPNAEASLAATLKFWRDWVGQCTYDGPYREAVARSLITLKAMTYAPSGAIVAAPTTSLPEEIGGVRNWDYRYTWLRDAAIMLSALLHTGYTAEAVAWRGWLVGAVAGDPENFQIMYGINGERELTERVLDWLPGYEGSAPVRVGNGAVGQLQLDVPGEVIDTLLVAHEHGIERCEDTAALHLGLVNYLRNHWKDADDGIWEVRGGRRHFVHSKIMAWVAVDRTVRLVEAGMLDADLGDLVQLREEIHADVCEHGFDETRNTFTQAYGSRELDASLLLIPRTGFLPPDDPRVIGTVDAVMRELATPDGLVRRYPTAGAAQGLDGLPGGEGAFLLCSFWLVDALALTGRLAQARALYQRLLELRSDVGLLAEEYDPLTRRQVGNYPQGFPHAGVVQSAVLLQERAQACMPVIAA
ncbi:glycoside hydrolase family 15 protein [Streptomyces sp. NPDC093149]|uniref:glycoside hydrolase family 15 protein n=1 Tax=Streptomyces sp. NPDC093149 TaxID=3366031 RepID=UPI003811CF02